MSVVSGLFCLETILPMEVGSHSCRRAVALAGRVGAGCHPGLVTLREQRCLEKHLEAVLKMKQDASHTCVVVQTIERNHAHT